MKECAIMPTATTTTIDNETGFKCEPFKLPVINNTPFTVEPLALQVIPDCGFSTFEEMLRKEVLPLWKALQHEDIPDGAYLTVPFAMPWEQLTVDGDTFNPQFEELRVWKDGDFVFRCRIKYTDSVVETNMMNLKNYIDKLEVQE